ncbi:hypothetical protein OAU50_05080 [Planctomycetota bacterium]|nr:hypothetical protein [Planctomycetota bacterium]
MRKLSFLLLGLILTACAGKILRPEPERDTVLHSPAESADTWRVEGELYGYDDAKHRQIKLRLIDADNDKPITARCPLLGMHSPRGAISGPYLSDQYSRVGWPSTDGRLEVTHQYGSRWGAGEIEIPLPDGYQFAVAPDSTFATAIVQTEQEVVLFYRKRPTLKVTVRDSSGAKVEDAGWYAVPTKPDPAMLAYASQRRNGFDGDPPPEDWVKRYIANPFHSNDLTPFVKTARYANGWGYLFSNLHCGVVPNEGNFTIESLFLGEWDLVVFTGVENFVRVPLTLKRGRNEVSVEVEDTWYIHSTFTCHGKAHAAVEGYDTSGWFDASLRNVRSDPRLVDGWDAESYSSHWQGNMLTLNLRFTEASTYELRVEDVPLIFDVVWDETLSNAYLLDIPPEDSEPAWAEWTPTFLVDGKPYPRAAGWFHSSELQTEGMASGETLMFGPGHCTVFLPCNERHDFVLKPAEKRKDSFELEWGTVRVTVDRFIWDRLSSQCVDIDDDKDNPIEFDESGWKDGQLTVETKLAASWHEYKVGDFKGEFRLRAGDTINLEFTKEHCSGLERLKIKDPQNQVRSQPYFDHTEFRPTLPDEYDDSPTLFPSLEDAIVFEDDDGTFYAYAPKGSSFMEVGWASIPVNFPGEIEISDALITEHQNECFVSVEDYDKEWRYVLRHENGSDVHFSGSRDIPQGRYTLYVFDDRFFAEYSFEAKDELVIRPFQLDWQDMIRVTVKTHGLGDAIDGTVRWDLHMNDLDRDIWFGEHSIMLGGWELPGEVEYWLPRGRYELHPWRGHESPTKFEVTEKPVIIELDE